MKATSLASEFKNKNHRALTRLISLAEEKDMTVCELLRTLYQPQSSARIIGITGPPGAGKSSLISYLIKFIRRKQQTVAILAVDPMSPFTGGALLGDRIRLAEHFNDPSVFIRSLSTRGKLGGLSMATRTSVHLCVAFGFDHIIVETVGVGQSELDIRKVADLCLVVLTPESGDTVQTMKAGILEIADIFVVHKADREGADALASELKGMVNRTHAEEIPIIKTSLKDKISIEKLFDLTQELLENRSTMIKKRREIFSGETLTELFEDYVRREATRWVHKKIGKVKNPYDTYLQLTKQYPAKGLFPK